MEVVLARRIFRHEVHAVAVAWPDVLAGIVGGSLAIRQAAADERGLLPHDLSVMTTHPCASSRCRIEVSFLLVSPRFHDISDGAITVSDVFTNTMVATG